MDTDNFVPPTCSQLDNFLTALTCNDDALRDYLQEVLGSCFNDTGNRIYIFYSLLRSSGVSTLMTLLEALLGIPNVSRCDLSSLSDGELPIEIIKSRLILASVSSEALVRGANLKMLVGGDPIFVENDVIQVWRKIFITTNSRLQFEDNPGLRHRIVVIPMNAHFVDSVPFLLRKLKNQLTMSAFLNWLLIGADRARNQFKSLPEVVESATNQYFEMGG